MMGEIIIELAKDRYFPQEIVRGILKLKIERPLEVSALKLEIVGLEKTHIQAAHGRSAFIFSENNYIIKEDVILHSTQDNENELEPGEHEFYFKFRMPKYALPTYFGTNASISYNLNAKVEKQDFPDIGCTKPILVQKYKKVPQRLKEPVHFKSQKYFNPNDLNPGLYVELAQTGYIAGEEIWGYITLKNIATLRLKNIVLELIGEEYTFAQKHHRTTVLYRIKKKIPTHDIREGMPIQFIFPTQKGIPANYESMFSSLKWIFEVRLNISSIFQVKANHEIEIVG